MGTTVSNRYSDEFKVEAVKEARTSGNISGTSRKLGVHVNTLSRWIKEFDEVNLGLFDDSQLEEENDKEDVENQDPILTTEADNISQLKSKIEILTNEVESLEKEKAQLLIDLRTAQESAGQLQKDLMNSQQYIGRMYIENERLKEKISNITEEY